MTLSQWLPCIGLHYPVVGAYYLAYLCCMKKKKKKNILYSIFTEICPEKFVLKRSLEWVYEPDVIFADLLCSTSNCS